MSVKAYVDSLVEDCCGEILDILGGNGPLMPHELRRALRMEQHVAMAIIDKALARLTSERKIAQHGLYLHTVVSHAQ